ncbi:MAG: HDOD domain-containing protein [Deltaproteobacteria bacterium]|nr:HDOD domain-containing protein [Deltaproteobacteria bacterium]
MEKPSHLPRNPVASGSYAISKGKGEILEAYLGTCVGVTLCDPKANIGGLIHLLLPEPTGIDKLWNPENYATTGLPLFIQSLCNAGASREDMVACIAGGALVGPIAERDLILDIGGRNAEVAEGILRREGIPIRKAETGGFFTCRLSLNLQTWKSHIEPLGISPVPSRRKMARKPTPDQLDEAMERVRPIPQIALKIIRMLHDINQSLADLAQEVRQDQIISARVIRLCCSALFNRKMGIDSIDRAMVMMGEKRFLQLVVSASIEGFFPKNGGGYSLCKGGVHKHALGTAMISESLANFTGLVSPDIAYTAGLLHDIGKVVLDQYITPAYPLFYRRTQMDGADLISVEKEEFGSTHTEVGGRLADNWSLPDVITDAIRFHHAPEDALVKPELAHLVYLADLLMSRFLVGQELDRLNTDTLASRLKTLGIRPDQLPVIIDNIPKQLFSSPMPASRL